MQSMKVLNVKIKKIVQILATSMYLYSLCTVLSETTVQRQHECIRFCFRRRRPQLAAGRRPYGQRAFCAPYSWFTVDITWDRPAPKIASLSTVQQQYSVS